MLARIEQGFTLLEVMVAVLLLSLGYVAVLQSFSSSLKRLGRDGEKRQVYLEQELVLSRQLRFPDPVAANGEGEEYLGGHHYVLIRQASPSGLLHGLKLVPLP